MKSSEMFAKDRIRFGGGSLLKSHALRFIWILRKCQGSRNPFWRIWRKLMERRYGLEISSGAGIGEGFYLGHAFGITVNPHATIGRNCNIHKGVTIGQENRGKRKGAPAIGDRVWIGVNSTIVGAVNIGEDVLVAPNTYVNCDVPSHSIVIGNPCKIISREGATKGYINRCV